VMVTARLPNTGSGSNSSTLKSEHEVIGRQGV
jgi:hypothetical protein